MAEAMICDSQAARIFLSARNWIVLNFGDDDFFHYLEEKYFKLGTEKNGEFEAMIGPIMTCEGPRIAFWIRILDTPENRQSLINGLMEFYSLRYIDPKKFVEQLEKIHQDILNHLDEWYPIQRDSTGRGSGNKEG